MSSELLTRFRRIIAPAWAMVAILLLGGCGKGSGTQAGSVQFYHLKGQVVALDPLSKRVTIAHEDIPNYMMGMTMPFTVKDTSVLQRIEVGDSVTGVLAVQHPAVWIDSLKVIWKMSAAEVH